jgi:glutathione synthase/RimK-type ligase-like ATP-grasp enzyme
MPSICFLVSTTGDAHNDNRARLPAAFAAAHWDVEVHDHQALTVDAGRVCADTQPLETFDLVWVLGLGQRETFLDRMQLLAALDPTRFVTSARALLEWHAKYHLAVGPFAAFHPETYASADPRWLAERIARGGKWIAKPAGGSYGREVYALTGDDPNLAVILDALTGHDGSRYCVLQRFVEDAARGEKRVLLANGEPVGCYLRRATRDHRTNLAVEATAERTTLNAEENALVRKVGAHLAGHGVRFAAVDLVYP